MAKGDPIGVSAKKSGAIEAARRREPRRRVSLRLAVADVLEDRKLLSTTCLTSSTASAAQSLSPVVHTTLIDYGAVSSGVIADASGGVAAPYTPAEMEGAYGLNDISFSGVTGNGAGQTIAIVDAYNDPTIITDANTFSSKFGLPSFNSTGDPTLQVLNQTGGTSLPSNSSAGGWDVEESLDVEWAHAVAPDANIILFEAAGADFGDLLTAVQTAAKTTGVSAVSMSWGSSEFSGEQSYDSYFTTPSGHPGVTFLSSSGDDGTPAGYPATSPNVVGVGGTSLTIDSGNTYGGETGWSGSSGGVSAYESLPSYQSNLDGVNGSSTSFRNSPDISMDANPSTGVYVLDTFYSSSYLQVGGTSLSSPMMAGVIAIADQGRALAGLSSLNGASQVLPTLYTLPSSDFHDITSGNNGLSAGVGYDLVTGIGSPVANELVPALVGNSSLTITTNPASQSVSAGSNVIFTAAASGSPTPTVQWYVEAAGSTSFSAISGATSTTLSLNGVTLSQNGSEYEAVFSNSSGSATTAPATLTVTSVATKPVVTTNPTSQSVGTGQSATFTAAASGTPTPTVQWYVEASGATSFSAVSGATSTTLVLNNVTASQNSSEYEAVFTNSSGSATTTPATLTVTASQPPKIVTNPTSQTVKAGTAVTFSASASGSPTPTVQWYVEAAGAKSFSAISGATSTTLKLGSANSSEDGSLYEAVFTGDGTSVATTAAKLTVLYAPTVTLNPRSQSVAAGKSVTFTAAASAEPVATVQWYVRPTGSTSFTLISGQTSTTLTLTDVSSTMNGFAYEAVFSNSQGTTKTSVATLTVTAAHSNTVSGHSVFPSAASPSAATPLQLGFNALETEAAGTDVIDNLWLWSEA